MIMEERRYRRHGGFVWPLILITAGVIFLLNNLGMLSWSVWDVLWRFWPIVLIAIGLDILFGRRSLLGSLLALVLIVALIGGAVWYAVTQSSIIAGQAITTDQVVQELSGATSADVQISFGAGSLHIGALKESANLIEGTIGTGPGETVRRDFAVNGNVAHFQLKSEGVPIMPFGPRRYDQSWNLDLSPSVPMVLHVSSGVGESVLDLSALQLTNLEVSSGVGQMQLQLPAHGRVQAKVSGGIGQVVVIIPAGMAARIHASTGLGGVSISSRFQRNGRDYVSANYATADDRVDLDISGGIGQVVVR
jgi:hypothetical protein